MARRKIIVSARCSQMKYRIPPNQPPEQTPAGANTHTYVRKKFKHIVGYILTDGNKAPKVVEGVATDIDLINDFKKYFKLKQSAT